MKSIIAVTEPDSQLGALEQSRRAAEMLQAGGMYVAQPWVYFAVIHN